MKRPSLARTIALCCGALTCLQSPLPASAVCRVVVPLGESGGIEFDPTTLVLYVLAPGQPLGTQCVPSGMARDAGPAADDDASVSFPDEDGGAPMTPADGGMAGLAGSAGRACPEGTIEVPRRGGVVHMVVQPMVLSTRGRAGLVMPVPARPDIHAAHPGVFDALRERLQPRIEINKTYVEDRTLGYQCRDPKYRSSSGDDDGCGGGYDPGPSGSDAGRYYDPKTKDDPVQRVVFDDGMVIFANALSTRDYDVTVVNASTPAALSQWLDQNRFAHDADDDAAFAAYVKQGAWFVALDVHPQFRDLEPLVVSWPGETIPILNELQYDPAGGKLFTDIFVMAQTRMDAADRLSETLYAAPAGFGGELEGFGLGEGWITQLRSTRETSVALPDSKLTPVFNGEVRPVLEKAVEERIPSSECPSANDGGCFCSLDRPPADRIWANFAPALFALLWMALRTRVRRRDQRDSRSE